MELTKNLEMNQLLSLYGNLLTDNQRAVMERYYFDNLSLTEIAQEFSISRQAVSDLMGRVVKTLHDYEHKLHLLDTQTKMRAQLNDLVQTCTDTPTKNKLQKIIHLLEE